MINQIPLLSALLHDRAAYETIREHIDESDLNAHGGAIYRLICEYYERDKGAKACDKLLILDRLKRKLPKQADNFTQLFREMSPELGSTNVVREVLALKRQVAGGELAIAIAGDKSPAEVSHLLETYTYLNDVTDLLDAGGTIPLLETGFADLMKDGQDPSKLIKLLPRRLNRYLRGGVLPGHTVVIIGRVNVGKSALAINNIGGFLRQGKKVLLIENEDLAEDVKRRIGIRLVHKSLLWAEKYPQSFERGCKKRGSDLLMIPDPVPGTVRDIDRAAAILKPDVIVVNQLRHLAPNKDAASDNTGAVDRVAQQLRALGKRRRILMVLVGAALEGDRDREGNPRERAVLDMSDSYGSRTGVPGVADVMLAIGNNYDLKERGMVAISLCKNKRGPGEPVLYQYVNLENCVFRDA